jgi:hypothetical protein
MTELTDATTSKAVTMNTSPRTRLSEVLFLTRESLLTSLRPTAEIRRSPGEPSALVMIYLPEERKELANAIVRVHLIRGHYFSVSER